MTFTLDRPIAVDRVATARRFDRDRAAFAALLLATGVLYLWGLGASGWANGFYSAAVQAGAHSWKAFFFGSFDASSFITVDKPPAALWVMELSARVFGVNAWSMLVPQALEGVAAVALLYATVRRRFGVNAGLVAGAVLATTPVAALMFRFNNPDALLTLLLVAAAYAMVRALEDARTRWVVVAGACIGFGFLTKMMQAFLVVPGFGAVYLFAAPTTLRRRVLQIGAGLASILVSAGWWIAAVALTPASSRPYIGGSQHNSIIELVLGYNGFGRLTGNETGSVGGGAAGQSGRWGATGITRMFGSEFGSQISWLLPAALVFLVVMLWLTRRRPRIDGRRAQVLLWGSWLVVTGLTFSLAKGIIHPYYSVALAPAIGALVGIGATATWQSRRHLAPRVTLATALAVTALWSWALLDRTPSWHPELRELVLVTGVVAAVGVVAAPWLSRRLAAGVVVAAVVTGVAGPTAYAVETAARPQSGAIPSAGPASAGGFGPGGAPGGFGRGGAPGGFRGAAPAGVMPGALGGRAGGNTTGGRLGGLLDTATPSSALVAALKRDASRYSWVAATIGSNNAAGLQLGSDLPVMSIGGFNGTDPTPSLAEFQALVKAGRIHYFVAGGGMGGGPGGVGGSGSSTSTQISAWVSQHFTATTLGGVTVYDLSVS
ncbi:MAG TPA: glycosyltransferase family 39 protein [Mycobacteriales bacterium]|jgi:4-amino-4-deoxy-L-arabinose transferase-like glycosyltransferase|nr:glycosyltransferase family 39 protein [Mycobacteriales bacterium]